MPPPPRPGNIAGLCVARLRGHGDLTRFTIDAGITFMDNAWEYHHGRSEAVMGRALLGRRENHLEMLSHGVQFDTCQLPLNCFDSLLRSFERQMLPELLRRGIAPIGMKSLCG